MLQISPSVKRRAFFKPVRRPALPGLGFISFMSFMVKCIWFFVIFRAFRGKSVFFVFLCLRARPVFVLQTLSLSCFRRNPKRRRVAALQSSYGGQVLLRRTRDCCAIIKAGQATGAPRLWLHFLHGARHFPFPHISVHWRPFAVKQISVEKNLTFKNAFYGII